MQSLRPLHRPTLSDLLISGMFKLFQILLVTFVAIFTMLGIVVILFGVVSFLFSTPGTGGTSTLIFAVSSRTTGLIFGIAGLLLLFFFTLWTWRKLRR